MAQEQLRIEKVLEYLLLSLLREHPSGLDADLAYRVLEQTYRFPLAWHQPLPAGGSNFKKLKEAGLDWRALSPDELASRVHVEPFWKNRLRYVVRHLRDQGLLARASRGLWQLTDAGLSTSSTLRPEALSFSPDERRVFDEPDELSGQQQRLEEDGGFSPGSSEDAYRRVLRSIAQRQGQPRFRARLLEAYEGRCALTGCDAVEALEAAHIVPASERGGNHVTNGLLLRADLHTLFDLNRMGIHPHDLTLRIARTLKETCFRDLSGQRLRLPKHPGARPDKAALTRRWEKFLAAEGSEQVPDPSALHHEPLRKKAAPGSR
jgi:hypothetical protein